MEGVSKADPRESVRRSRSDEVTTQLAVTAARAGQTPHQRVHLTENLSRVGVRSQRQICKKRRRLMRGLGSSMISRMLAHQTSNGFTVCG